MQVNGSVAPGFEPVREAFADQLAGGGELGASVAAYVAGRLVIDLWGGDWQRDTVAMAYSVVKPVVAAAALAAVQRGLLDLDAPLTAYWPGYGSQGGDTTTLRQALAHQAGVAWLPPGVDLTDWEATCSALAASEPAWRPGTAHGEHALTYGHLVGETVRRATGQPFEAWLRETVTGPLGMDLHLSVDATLATRTADLVEPTGTWSEEVLAARGERWRAALTGTPDPLDPAVVNGPRWRRSAVPAISGYTDARSLARFHAAWAAGGESVLDAGVIREALRPQARGPDLVLGSDVTWGLGPQLEGAQFGLGGTGGSSGYGDLDRRSGFGYVTRRLGSHDRAIAVEEAFEACLAG